MLPHKIALQRISKSARITPNKIVLKFTKTYATDNQVLLKEFALVTKQSFIDLVLFYLTKPLLKYFLKTSLLLSSEQIHFKLTELTSDMSSKHQCHFNQTS